MQTASHINVHVIEHDLRNLWEQLAETPQAQGVQPVMRVCVLNLIVYAPGEHASEEVNQIMADVTTQHPSRIFVILPKYGAPEADLSAWVTALCHLSAGGHKQVCCEQIMITAGDGALYRLPSLMRPLLVPDLPVVLWWRDIPRFENRLFAGLAQDCDRVILDSARFEDPEDGLAGLVTLINHRPQWAAFRDLNWSRLTPWRLSVAGFFDAPDWRAYLNQLRRVEVNCTSASDNRASIPSQALLILSWLASRLKWHATSKPRRRGKNTYQVALASGNLLIDVEITSAPAAAGTQEGLHAVKLVAEGTPAAEFVVSRSEEDGVYLRADVELAGARVARKVSPLRSQDEAQLIAKELEILDRDAMFEQALAFFASIPR